jgi:hypothetical protein
VSNIKIKRSGGRYINRQSDGSIWISEGDRSFSCCGQVFNNVCNVHGLLGLGKKYKRYFAVDDGILKYHKKLHIKGLRVVVVKNRDSSVGPIIDVRYGYIPKSDFKTLLGKRKIKPLRNNKVILLKESDMFFKSI